MSNHNTGTPGALFWGIGGIALVWNLMGATVYWATVTMTPERLSEIPPGEQVFYENIPMWVTSAFAIAVFAGVLGSLALLLRRRWAWPLFLLSLTGVLVQQFHTFFLTDLPRLMSTSQMVLPALVVVIAIFLVWFSRSTATRGLLA